MTASFLREFSPDEGFVKKVFPSCFKTLVQLLPAGSSFRNLFLSVRILTPEDVALFGFCAGNGRGGADRKTEEKKFREFLKRVKGKGRGFG
jgi:hypothetical protein